MVVGGENRLGIDKWPTTAVDARFLNPHLLWLELNGAVGVYCIERFS